MPVKFSQEEFIKKVKEIHGEKLNFDKSIYDGMDKHVIVTCPIHGDFLIKPVGLIHQKHGCKYCSHQSYPSTKEMFIEKATKIHNCKYTYNNVVYKNNKTKVCVTCPIHGDFDVRPDNHLHGSGCPRCGKISMAEKEKFTKDKFIKLSRKVHGDKYDYSKVEYKDYKEKICIVCPKHGEFWQTPDNHLHSHGCPYCKESKLENEVCNLLLENKIPFIRQKTYSWLKYRSNLFLDFYLPTYNTAIECQGMQHYEPADFFGGEKDFKKRIVRDAVKKALCEKNGIKMLYFSNEKGKNILNNINDLLKEIKNESTINT